MSWTAEMRWPRGAPEDSADLESPLPMESSEQCPAGAACPSTSANGTEGFRAESAAAGSFRPLPSTSTLGSDGSGRDLPPDSDGGSAGSKLAPTGFPRFLSLKRSLTGLTQASFDTASSARPVALGPADGWRARAFHAMNGTYFECVCSCFILLDCVSLGVNANGDWNANDSFDKPLGLRLAEHLLILFFTGEIVVRIIVCGPRWLTIS